MGEITGIAWTDSTMNFWEGCTKVGPGCDNCYAAERDVRFHDGSHWGAGAPRRQMSQHTRNNPLRWQKGAAEFQRLRGHPQRVFCSSLADIFDNEVPAEWRAEAFAMMEATPDLRWQLCTKRVSNVAKMVPDRWTAPGGWPANVGLLITTVTAAEIARDVPRLLDLKDAYKLPWVGLSVEPMIEDVVPALKALRQGPELERIGCKITDLDWVIFGGESGPNARDFYMMWALHGIAWCRHYGIAAFFKQMGARPHYASGTRIELKDKSGSDPSEWPATDGDLLHTREFPAALC